MQQSLRPSSSASTIRPGTASKLQASFPLLPGYRRPGTSSGTVGRFNQNQSLNYQNGIMMVQTRLRPGAGPPPAQSLKMLDNQLPKDALHPGDISGRYSLKRQRQDHTMKTAVSSNLVVGKVGRAYVPATAMLKQSGSLQNLLGSSSTIASEADDYSLASATTAYRPSPNNLAPSAPVLLFRGYYFEDVIESQIESRRIHRCDIYFYTEDDSVEIIEQKTENSGMPQGSILRRGKVPGVTADSFKIGNSPTIYARSYSIIAANESTKEYARNVLGWPEDCLGTLPWPEDTFIKKNLEKMMRETGFGNVNRNRKMHPQKEYMEALLGKPTSMSDLGSFLVNGQKCLCFDVIWDDTQKLYGDVRSYKLNYFLSDDTMEVLPVHTRNDGRDQFPKLLKRSKVPVDIARPNGPKYTWQDLKIGTTINIYRRPMIITSADQFTRKFYASKGVPLRQDFDPIEPYHVQYERQIPPYNGFGSEEDSLRSCTGSIKATPVKKEFFYDRRGQVIRFNARMVSRKSEDKNRRFVIQYFLEDNTMSIREPPIRNSGVVGGSFLGRCPCKHPDGSKILPINFYVGAVVEVNCHKFLLGEADEWSYRLMENDCVGNFPYSDFERLQLVVGQYATEISQYFAKNDLSMITFDDMVVCLTAVGLKLKKQELITIWRKVDRRGKGKVSFMKLVKLAKGQPLHVTIGSGW